MDDPGNRSARIRSVEATSRPKNKLYLMINKTPTHEEITQRAAALWHERGKPSGQDEAIWLEAEQQMASEPLPEGQSEHAKKEKAALKRKEALAPQTPKKPAAPKRQPAPPGKPLYKND